MINAKIIVDYFINKYKFIIKKKDNGKINEASHIENDLPTIINNNGDKEWWVNKQKHRENDLPAIEKTNGEKEWWINGKLHRGNGLPAVVYPDGREEYWEYGRQLNEEEIKHRIELRELHQTLTNDLTTNSQKSKLKKL